MYYLFNTAKMCQREYEQGFLHSTYGQNYELPNLLDLLTFFKWFIKLSWLYFYNPALLER